MKSKQFCSVCKEWLEMEVVPTGDGEEDDGVVWFRCPQCKGFLPKLKGTDPAAVAAADRTDTGAGTATEGAEVAPDTKPAGPGESDADDLPWDSPADMMASGGMKSAREEGEPPPEDEVDEEAAGEAAKGKSGPTEPVAEYAALLERTDQGNPKPYRPWDTYEVGDCIMHLAWEDCGVVVAKEKLPGGRQVIKCYFGDAGVVRLIEQAPR